MSTSRDQRSGRRHLDSPDEDGGGDDEGEGRSAGQMIVILVLLVALVGAGWWITAALRSNAAIQDCVAAGRTNCAPIR